MYTGFIIFELCTKKFAVELNDFPMILKPEEYRTQKRGKTFYRIDNMDIEIIDIAPNLKLEKNLMTEKTRILVGVSFDRFYGIIVDQVHHIINYDQPSKTNEFYEVKKKIYKVNEQNLIENLNVSIKVPGVLG